MKLDFESPSNALEQKRWIDDVKLGVPTRLRFNSS